MQPKVSKLKNGMDFLHIPFKEAAGVSIMILCKVGSRHESSDTHGLAHFVEHMMFKGTPTRPTSRDIGMAIEKIGGSSNAFTSYDYTGYYIKVPVENFVPAVEILADMVQNSKFDQSEIEKERGVIVEEIRMYEDRPMSKAPSLWYQKFFENTSLGHDIAGDIASVRGFSRDHFVNFVKFHYNADNLLLVISGSIEASEADDIAERCFGEIEIGQASTHDVIATKKLNTPVVFNSQKQIEQSHIVLGGYGYERTYQNRYVLDVADAILSKGFGSRLFQVIRDELGLAYYVYSSFVPFEEVGAFKVGLGVENSKVHLAVDAVINQLRDIIEGKFDDEELVRAKNFILGSMIVEMESTDDFATWYGIQQLLDGKYDRIDQVREQIQKVTKDDVVRELQNTIAGQNLLLTAVTPHDKLDDDALKNILKL